MANNANEVAEVTGNIHLNRTQVSDLFFNSALPCYNGLFKTKVAPSREDIAKAIETDAIDFSNMIGCQVGFEHLTADFLKRL